MLSWFQNGRELGEKLFMGSGQGNNSFTIKVWRVSWVTEYKKGPENKMKSHHKAKVIMSVTNLLNFL